MHDFDVFPERMKFTWYSVPPRILQTAAWLPARLLLNFFCHFEVRELENLNGIRQAIFACNHSSELDPIVLTAALSPFGRFAPMFYVTAPMNRFKHKGFKWRRHIYSKTFFKAWGAYPTRASLHDYGLTLKDYLQILRDGGSVCIFPEGGITKTGELGKAHGGAAFLARTTQVPIIPVAIKGVFHVTGKGFFLQKCPVSVTFGEPHYISNADEPSNNQHEYKQRAQHVMNIVQALLKSS